MKSNIFLILAGLMVLAFGASQPVQAQPKPWVGGWWDYETNFAAVVPQKSGARDFHPQQWQSREIELSYEEREDTIERLKEYGFIDSLTASQHIATVWTGPYFEYLAYPDQLYVMDIIALHYDILASDYGMFVIRRAKNGDFVGSYTEYGLQIE